MAKPIHCRIAAWPVAQTLLIVWLLSFGLMSNNDAVAGSLPVETVIEKQGDAEQGRKLFNGKGICYYCHGIDGNIDKRPQLNSETNRIIDRLKPQPANLRDPNKLKLKADDERFRLIREGHVETGMFPDKVLMDDEIKDILAYLSELRRNGTLQGPAQ